jgi:uncharacterized protein (TIGR02594 family)
MNITLHDIASRFVGVKEVPGPLSNPAVLAMLRLDADWPQDDEVDWCSAALNYWAWLIRLPRSKSLMARSWLSVGKPIPLVAARPEFDVVVLWRGGISSPFGHAGVFDELPGDGTVRLLAGNQGKQVSIAPFPTERILGVRRLLEE